MDTHSHRCPQCGDLVMHYEEDDMTCEDFIEYIVDDCIQLDEALTS